MTTTPFPGTDEFNQVWTRAFFLADDVVDTQHLLVGMLHIPRIKELLDACDVTTVVLNELVRSAPPEPGDEGRMLGVTVEPTSFSSAAAAALDRAQAQPSLSEDAERTPADVLLAILADSQNGASSILTECGVDLTELRDALREDLIPARVEKVPFDLRRTRDNLLGRTRYQGKGRGVRNWLRNRMIGVSSLNYASHPVLWMRLEADELGRAEGGRVRTDDVLSALIATHEVALAYPHLMRSAREKYTGGQALLAAGLNHDRIAAARASVDLGQDAVALPGHTRDWPQDTGQVLRQLLCADGTRSSRLLAHLGVKPSDLVVLGPKTF